MAAEPVMLPVVGDDARHQHRSRNFKADALTGEGDGRIR
jgi:hypothetical protein